ncbi:MAG: ABC transporter ATP-binding protein [Saccharofermentanales bacterium]
MAGGFGGGPGGPGSGLGGGRFHFDDAESRPVISMKIISRIAGYFYAYWKLLMLLVFCIVITAVLGLIPPVLTKNIIDIALPEKDINLLIILIVSTFGATVLSGLILVGQNYLNSWISKHIINDLRNSMFSHLQFMSIRFFSDVQAGEITSRMNNDIGGIESIFAGTFVQILQNAFIFISTAAILFITNWKLAIVSMVILPLFVIPTRKVGRVRWKIATQTQEKMAELNTIIQETLNIGGTFLVKLFTKEKHQQEAFEKVNKEVTRLQMKESLAGRWFFMTITTIVSIGPVIIYLVGGILMIRYGEISIGSIVMFVALLGRLYGPVTSFANISVDITRSLALFDRIFQYLDMKQDIVDAPDAVPLDPVVGAIRFRDVCFSYSDKTETLKDINIDIRPGQLIAFVGPSGAGKTTITYLLPRLYDIGSGTITIDGTDIRKVTLESLRKQIGIVTQDTYLLNTTIRNNLLFSKEDAGEDEIIAACRAANIHDLIASLPEGYDTLVGERGIKLSGGEKQRLSIARALLKDPRIVILDEATSALDSVSESLIQEAIGPLLEGRTSLVIAHRLSTIMAADCIYVVENGRIAEFGTHEELLVMSGLYKELCEKQFRNHTEN